MTRQDDVPSPLAGWLSDLPQDYCGTLYAKLRSPVGISIWKKVPVWGQVCDGTPHRSAVHLMLYNHFPFRGKGWTYTEWRSEPYNPELCDRPTRGEVPDPKPYSGVAYDP